MKIEHLQYNNSVSRNQDSIDLLAMLRPVILYLFVFSLLFMGIEGAVDSVDGEHPLGEKYAHILDSSDSLSPDVDDMTTAASIVVTVTASTSQGISPS
ncbi:hypothetical protein [Dasania phycosphaerae]|uniref:hypothetical protein n=1 Tax=Dasania phycosphaerae TaxID=2950436 RepID=UPI0022A7C19C|nr:hypothetical protein [Dasania phycosphaerae]